MSGAYSEKFSGRGHQFSSISQEQIFSAKLILSNLSTKNDSIGESGGMLPRKIFENLHTVMAILALFKQLFSGKSLSHFRLLTLSASSMMHFVRTVSIMRA